MREYFTVLFAVCLISGIVTTLAPSESAKKYIEYLCGLCVICCIVLPISDVFTSEIELGDIFGGYEANTQDYEEIYNRFWEAEDKKAAEDALALGLSDRLGIGNGELAVNLCVSGNGSERVLEGAIVYIIDMRALDASPDIIRSYIADTAGVECEIIYDFSDE